MTLIDMEMPMDCGECRLMKGDKYETRYTRSSDHSIYCS